MVLVCIGFACVVDRENSVFMFFRLSHLAFAFARSSETALSAAVGLRIERRCEFRCAFGCRTFTSGFRI